MATNQRRVYYLTQPQPNTNTTPILDNNINLQQTTKDFIENDIISQRLLGQNQLYNATTAIANFVNQTQQFLWSTSLSPSLGPLKNITTIPDAYFRVTSRVPPLDPELNITRLFNSVSTSLTTQAWMINENDGGTSPLFHCYGYEDVCAPVLAGSQPCASSWCDNSCTNEASWVGPSTKVLTILLPILIALAFLAKSVIAFIVFARRKRETGSHLNIYLGAHTLADLAFLFCAGILQYLTWVGGGVSPNYYKMRRRDRSRNDFDGSSMRPISSSPNARRHGGLWENFAAKFVRIDSYFFALSEAFWLISMYVLIAAAIDRLLRWRLRQAGDLRNTIKSCHTWSAIFTVLLIYVFGLSSALPRIWMAFERNFSHKFKNRVEGTRFYCRMYDWYSILISTIFPLLALFVLSSLLSHIICRDKRRVKKYIKDLKARETNENFTSTQPYILDSDENSPMVRTTGYIPQNGSNATYPRDADIGGIGSVVTPLRRPPPPPDLQDPTINHLGTYYTYNYNHNNDNFWNYAYKPRGFKASLSELNETKPGTVPRLSLPSKVISSTTKSATTPYGTNFNRNNNNSNNMNNNHHVSSQYDQFNDEWDDEELDETLREDRAAGSGYYEVSERGILMRQQDSGNFRRKNLVRQLWARTRSNFCLATLCFLTPLFVIPFAISQIWINRVQDGGPTIASIVFSQILQAFLYAKCLADFFVLLCFYDRFRRAFFNVCCGCFRQKRSNQLTSEYDHTRRSLKDRQQNYLNEHGNEETLVLNQSTNSQGQKMSSNKKWWKARDKHNPNITQTNEGIIETHPMTNQGTVSKTLNNEQVISHEKGKKHSWAQGIFSRKQKGSSNKNYRQLKGGDEPLMHTFQTEDGEFGLCYRPTTPTANSMLSSITREKEAQSNIKSLTQNLQEGACSPTSKSYIISHNNTNDPFVNESERYNTYNKSTLTSLRAANEVGASTFMQPKTSVTIINGPMDSDNKSLKTKHSMVMLSPTNGSAATTLHETSLDSSMGNLPPPVDVMLSDAVKPESGNTTGIKTPVSLYIANSEHPRILTSPSRPECMAQTDTRMTKLAFMQPQRNMGKEDYYGSGKIYNTPIHTQDVKVILSPSPPSESNNNNNVINGVDKVLEETSRTPTFIGVDLSTKHNTNSTKREKNQNLSMSQKHEYETSGNNPIYSDVKLYSDANKEQKMPNQVNGFHDDVDDYIDGNNEGNSQYISTFRTADSLYLAKDAANDGTKKTTTGFDVLNTTMNRYTPYYYYRLYIYVMFRPPSCSTYSTYSSQGKNMRSLFSTIPAAVTTQTKHPMMNNGDNHDVVVGSDQYEYARSRNVSDSYAGSSVLTNSSRTSNQTLNVPPSVTLIPDTQAKMYAQSTLITTFK